MQDKLTDTTIKNAKAKDKPYKLADGGGMYLLVNTKGQKWWRLDYRLNGKRKTISFGVYPDVPLKTARKRRAIAREQVAEGKNPSDIRKKEKAAIDGADSFRAVADEWLEKHSAKWTPKTLDGITTRLTNYVYPWLGDEPVSKITAVDLLAALRRIEEKGALETAHKVRQYCGQVFRYAIATGRATRDVSQDLRGALTPVNTQHYASITEPRKIGELLRAIDGYKGQPVTRYAMRLAPLVFLRPGELRRAAWEDIDLDSVELHRKLTLLGKVFALKIDPRVKPYPLIGRGRKRSDRRGISQCYQTMVFPGKGIDPRNFAAHKSREKYHS